MNKIIFFLLLTQTCFGQVKFGTGSCFVTYGDERLAKIEDLGIGVKMYTIKSTAHTRYIYFDNYGGCLGCGDGIQARKWKGVVRPAPLIETIPPSLRHECTKHEHDSGWVVSRRGQMTCSHDWTYTQGDIGYFAGRKKCPGMVNIVYNRHCACGQVETKVNSVWYE